MVQMLRREESDYIRGHGEGSRVGGGGGDYNVTPPPLQDHCLYLYIMNSLYHVYILFYKIILDIFF